MLKKVILLGCALFAVSLPSLAVEGKKPVKEPKIESRPLNQEEEATIKAWVSRALKDPDSAKFIFRDRVVSINGESEYIYCGLVNAKNSYGGYSGWMVFKSFIAKNKYERLIASTNIGQLPEMGEFGQIGKGQAPEKVIFDMCVEKGYFKGDYINADLIGKKVE
ncbi:exported hypothetical protein [Xenorhabdus bovienii str. oregonense]|uniref:Uncharacterized protein n=1 Tax=Xenorhabdus bovienii str. oregonense TaxID=1398202 RepID=A0A077NYQ0_XENBV|nr:hypothetical protein [Xenorhabdus bovienii]CDH07322.1 exported hypothetical protein [Xenorhabdus bovienii str. oregonense]